MPLNVFCFVFLPLEAFIRDQICFISKCFWASFNTVCLENCNGLYVGLSNASCDHSQFKIPQVHFLCLGFPPLALRSFLRFILRFYYFFLKPLNGSAPLYIFLHVTCWTTCSLRSLRTGWKSQKPVWKPGVKLHQLSSPNYGIISLYIFACFQKRILKLIFIPWLLTRGIKKMRKCVLTLVYYCFIVLWCFRAL